MLRLLRVQIEDAIAVDGIFATLIGDDGELQRAFIGSGRAFFLCGDNLSYRIENLLGSGKLYTVKIHSTKIATA